jgi:hypothetical protein
MFGLLEVLWEEALFAGVDVIGRHPIATDVQTRPLEVVKIVVVRVYRALQGTIK